MVGQRCGCALLLALLVNGLFATASRGDEADRFDLSLTLAAEYNDNLYEAKDNRQADFITRVRPGFALIHQAALWDWDLQYNLEYVHYVRRQHGDQLNHWLAAHGTLRLIDQFFFVQIDDLYSSVSLDDSDGSALQNIFSRQTDQNLLTLSPYLLFRVTSQLGIKTGYRYQNQYYSNANAIDWQGHGGFAEAKYAIGPRWDALANFDAMRIFPSPGTPYDRITPSLGVYHLFADRSHFALRGGVTFWRFAGGVNRQTPFGSVEIVQAFGRNLATVSAGVQYQTDPLLGASENRYARARLQRDYRRGLLGASVGYSRVWDATLGQGGISSVSASLDGTLEHSARLSSHAQLSATWYRDARVRPCRLLAGAGWKYLLDDDMALAFDYRFASNRTQLAGGDATYSNRFILSWSKVW